MSNEQLFEPPNLDGISIDPQDYADAAHVLMMLSQYAMLKFESMKAREAGLIPHAILVEHEMEKLYNKLPAWARW